MGDMDKSAKQRLAFLFGQSDLFKHFVKEDEVGKEGSHSAPLTATHR